jgi:hypothetical protein
LQAKNGLDNGVHFSNASGLQIKVEIGPVKVHNFHFPKARQQKRGVQRPFGVIGSLEEFCEIGLAVFTRERCDALGQMESLCHTWSADTLEELGDDHGIMQNRVRSEAVILFERDDVATFRRKIPMAVVIEVAPIEFRLVFAY